MQLIGIQLDTVWEDKAASHARVQALLRETNVTSGALIVLSEFFATGFSTDVAKIAEAEGEGESQTFLAQLAKQYKAFVLGGIVAREGSGRGRNQCVVYNPAGEEIARYWKLHPFSFGGETEYYDAGSQLVTFDWSGCTVAPFICYDVRFPEVLRRMAGPAKLFTVIANWPAPRRAHWITLLRARAIENQAYVIGVNRCGSDPKLTYAGDSLIIDPRGEVIADGGAIEGIIHAEVNLDDLDAYRHSFPALVDRRSEFNPS